MEELINDIKNNNKLLLDKKYLNKKYNDDNNIFHYCIIYNNLNLLKLLLNKYGNKYIFSVNKYGQNTFHLATKLKLKKLFFFY